jgi:hypothetical protein
MTSNSPLKTEKHSEIIKWVRKGKINHPNPWVFVENWVAFIFYKRGITTITALWSLYNGFEFLLVEE